jgi:hypothetical protein
MVFAFQHHHQAVDFFAIVILDGVAHFAIQSWTIACRCRARTVQRAEVHSINIHASACQVSKVQIVRFKSILVCLRHAKMVALAFHHLIPTCAIVKQAIWVQIVLLFMITASKLNKHSHLRVIK